MKSRRRIAISGIILLCALVSIFLWREGILWSLGAVLDRGSPPQKADMIVVLGGDSSGRRILTAAELARQGYAPKVLVSGAGEQYGRFESDLATEFAVKHGYAAELFIPSHYAAVSTRDEARADMAELRRRGVHRFLLVTSVYHTARAGRIFGREAGGLEMRVVAAPERYWKDGKWWQEREGRKIWFMEMLKTVADYLGI